VKRGSKRDSIQMGWAISCSIVILPWAIIPGQDPRILSNKIKLRIGFSRGVYLNLVCNVIGFYVDFAFTNFCLNLVVQLINNVFLLMS
jgi:hypothetical protein